MPIIPSESTDPKYAVLRYRDWENIKADVAEDRSDDLWLIDDAVVLRLQDLTVAPLLHSYASQIIGFTELLESYGIGDQTKIPALREIADYMHSKALEAEALAHRKLPD